MITILARNDRMAAVVAFSFSYSLTKLWNSLPSQVRLLSDANDFRSKLHDCSFLERVL